MELPEIVSWVQGGGTPALIVCTYFIYKLEARLARIEKAFEMIAQQLQIQIQEAPK
jgi:hypothetical protein